MKMFAAVFIVLSLVSCCASYVRVSSSEYHLSRVFARKGHVCALCGESYATTQIYAICNHKGYPLYNHSCTALHAALSTDITSLNGTGCGCLAYNCGCCAHLEIDQIGLNDTVCTNMTYLPDQYGVSLTVSVDGVVYYNNTVSLKNPPPICIGVPYLKKFASLCIKFYNMSVSQQTFSGCVMVIAKLEGLVLEDYKLGCFKMPPGPGPRPAALGRVVKHKTRPHLLTASTTVHLRVSGKDRSLGCRCYMLDCGCCAHLEIAEIGINNTACANLTFESKTSSVVMSISMDKKVYFNETISLKNLSPVCIPFLPVKEVDVCVQLYNVDIREGKLHGCSRVIARLEEHPVDIIDLGCFELPFPRARAIASSNVLYFKAHSQIKKILRLAYADAMKEKRFGNI